MLTPLPSLLFDSSTLLVVLVPIHLAGVSVRLKKHSGRVYSHFFGYVAWLAPEILLTIRKNVTFGQDPTATTLRPLMTYILSAVGVSSLLNIRGL